MCADEVSEPLCGERWQSGQLRLFNLFGTTEMSVWATAHEFTARSPVPPAPLPVGVPLSDTGVDLAADGAVVIRSATRHAYVNGKRIQCVSLCHLCACACQGAV